MNGVARMLADEQRYADGESVLREALNIHCRAYGEDCPVRQRTLFFLGRLLESDQRAAEAVPVLEQSVAIAKKNGDTEEAEEAQLALLRCTDAAPEQQ